MLLFVQTAIEKFGLVDILLGQRQTIHNSTCSYHSHYAAFFSMFDVVRFMCRIVHIMHAAGFSSVKMHTVTGPGNLIVAWLWLNCLRPVLVRL